MGKTRGSRSFTRLNLAKKGEKQLKKGARDHAACENGLQVKCGLVEGENQEQKTNTLLGEARLIFSDTRVNHKGFRKVKTMHGLRTLPSGGGAPEID